ncbi:MAG: phosphate acyltransferase PlsX [Candidatus Zixiibacteriota bacterium]|nr:MAG: phosphate acyltransferase PlsX [candidate division Zixibacteria bacterium]
MTVALDVMGADASPESIIEGGLQAARENGDDLKLVLVGKTEIINTFIKKQGDLPANVVIQDAPHSVAMADTPTEGIRKRTSSIAVGLMMQKKGGADAFVSAGNTGAVMASSILILGRVEGVNRPAIASFFPTSIGKPTLVLDVGANTECKPATLYQFGLMGSVYSSLMYGRTSPRVGLLSIGAERSKGNELILQAHDLFTRSDLNFIGNVEGRDVLTGDVDVVITDGFVGNILLKFAESIEGFLTCSLKRQISTNVFSRVGASLMRPFLKRLRRSFDYAESGGAPLLGVDGVSIICHGSSSPKAIKNAVVTAAEMVRHHVNENIRTEMNGVNNGNGNDA